MRPKSHIRSILRLFAISIGLAVALYGSYVGVTWYRYGRIAQLPSAEEQDQLLDRFMSRYEVVERHHVRVTAPAALTLATAPEMNLFESPVVRAVFKGRELILRGKPDESPRPSSLLKQVQSLGWGVLAEAPGREIVVGAVTKPWEANVTFRALPPDEFAGFREPEYVKIIWNLRADPIGANESIFRTETRAVATDSVARARFRRYWALFSPGIVLIRYMSLAPLKREAERRAREGEVVDADCGTSSSR